MEEFGQEEAKLWNTKKKINEKFLTWNGQTVPGGHKNGYYIII